jgi:hypothetical protein
VSQVAREVNDSHAAFTELPVDLVPAGESGFEALLKIVHQAYHIGIVVSAEQLI